MIYDPDCNRLVVFGGRSLRGDLDDTWSFDLDSRRWRVLAKGKPGPTRRYTHNAVYDPTTRRMLVWSGRHAEGGLLFRSEDAGDSWQALESPYYGSFFGITRAPTASTLLAFGLRGNLFRSTDDGDSWQQVDTGSDRTLAGKTSHAYL